MCKKVCQWFVSPQSWAAFIALVAGMLLFKLLWTFVVGVGVLGMGFQEASGPPDPADQFTPEDTQFLKDRAGLLVLFVFSVIATEEASFRLVPIAMGLFLRWIWKPLGWALVPLIIVASLSFGLIHVTNSDEITGQVVAASILFQGVGGLLYSLLFLKVTMLKLRRVFHGLVATFTAHVLWNALMVALILLPLMRA